MKISATVPTRIDLAGGTLDVYPLYLFEGGGLTVNAAIDVMARASLETRNDAKIVLRSVDLSYQEEIPSLGTMQFGGRLDLAKRVLHYYRPQMGLTIDIESQAPAGSGLGASSALLMALSHGLNALTERGLSSERILDVGANIEAQVIGIPTGKQDYFPPIFGGVCAMWFDVDGWTLESLSENPALIDGLNERVIVSFTGIPHHSAITNWAMLRRYIEKDGDTVARMRDIKAIASAMRECLLIPDWDRFGELLDEEWKLRKGLAEGVTTPRIDTIMAAAGSAGARASKICGAGGGGCMITAVEPDRADAVRAALSSAGAQVMPARVVAQGITLS